MKKLLAIVMVVAMMFSMSVVAMADGATVTATAAVERATEEEVTVTVSLAGDVSAYELRLYYGEAQVAATDLAADAKALNPLNMPNDVVAEGYHVHTGAVVMGGEAFDGAFATYTLTNIVEGATIDVVDGLSGDVLIDDLLIDVELPTPEPTVVPTEVPTEAPTEAPTEKPAPVDPTEKPADPTKAPVVPSDKNDTKAPQTADVAPVATMITLVVVAGLAIVALKKRATN